MDVFAELARLGSLVRQLQGALGGGRTRWGRVSGAGAKVVGSDGWTVARLGAGDYRITFTTAFPAVPSTQLTVGPVAAALDIKESAAEVPTTSTVRIAIYTSAAGVATDAEFTFSAIG